jgi:gliding motility-associated-like protein
MLLVRYTIALLLVLTVAISAHAQFGRPTIIGQRAVSTFENTPVTIQFDHLIVVDLNDFYPNGFTIKIFSGKDYSFENTTVTPKSGFTGTLTVEVAVNDGRYESNKFDLKISVEKRDNIRPTITNQQPLTVVAGGSITLDFLHFTVDDSDNNYPDDFTLKVHSGKDYDVNGTTVTPDNDFTGQLVVEVTVHDGQDESPKFDAIIEVTPAPNVPPVITGQRDITTDEDKALTIVPSNLEVEDPDDDYPQGFTLTVYNGDGYTVEGTTITPAKDFFGTLKVNVSVNDGEDDSEVYQIDVGVRAVNDPPVITGHAPLSTYIDTPLTIELGDLFVSDPDNVYPQGYKLKLFNGFNYKVDKSTITPDKNFLGTLYVPVTVEDGKDESEKYTLEIRVLTAPNVPPVITGQQSITITQGAQLEVQFFHLEVLDPDNSYPKDFTLRVLNGANYNVSGNLVTPNPTFIGTLSVRVTVNDGTATSNIFPLQVSVVPTSVDPQIVGQHSINIDEDQSVTIKLGDLIVVDEDDNYPVGFTLQVYPGEDYTVQGHLVTPAANMFGFLTVVVRVTDNDNRQSDPFNLIILVSPVNDAPVIAQLEPHAISYEPGTDPISISSSLNITDVDSDHLSLAEITFTGANYEKGRDELIFTDTANISGFFNPDAGKLTLIGFATLETYTHALRSVRYYYQIDFGEGESGGPILTGARILSLQVNDGQHAGEAKKRNIVLESGVDLDIPNAFTPNGDGANETWNVYALSNPHQCENADIRVYNKRGLLVFHSIGLETQWDGSYQNELLPTDTYYYTIDLNLTYAKRTFKGAVTLLR